MVDESKPPMRQIAELIDGIATARAESAERMLGECETALIEAQVGEKAALEALADRDAEIAKLKALLDAALATAAERQKTINVILESRKRDYAELAETRADLAGLQCAMLATPEQRGGYATTAVPPAESHRAWPPAAEIAKWVDDWHAGKIPTPIEPAPPAADPRVDALCRVVVTMANMHWPKEWGLSLSPLLHADLETIGARR